MGRGRQQKGRGGPAGAPADPGAGKRRPPARELRAGFRVWLAVDEGLLLGSGRAQLLRALAETGSISAAARALSMSYRKAWRLVDSMSRAAPLPLVERARGGAGGGGATLTDFGALLLAAFVALERDLRGVCAQHETRLGALMAARHRARRPAARR